MTLVRLLTRAEAETIVSGLVATAIKDGGAPLTVGVAGSDGVMIALQRMDGAPTLGVNMVVAKLHTAVVGRKDTIERHGKGINPADYNDPLITTFGGGVVLRHDGQVIGAIAVSGRTPEEDHQLCDGARRAFGSGQPG
jgi:glc operon protein GlcG